MISKHPNCLQCIHYFITYEQAKPYGCRAMGFKSRRKPSIVVFEASGLSCQRFKKKNGSDNSRGPSWTA